MLEKAETRFWFARELDGMEMLRSNHLDPAYPRHMHATFTIGIVDTGVVINQSRGATSTIPENCVYMFNPEEVHSGYAPTSTLISHRTFYPSESALVNLAQEIGFQGKPYFKSPACFDAETVSKLRHLHRLLEYSESALERQSAIIEIFGHLLKKHLRLRKRGSRLGSESRAVNTIRDCLDEHFGENVSLGDLSHLVNLDRAYLIRHFRASVGIPPYSYLLQKRIEKAKTLLRSGERPAQVALMVGFGDQSHLNLHFKKVMNITPGQYAKSHYLPRRMFAS